MVSPTVYKGHNSPRLRYLVDNWAPSVKQTSTNRYTIVHDEGLLQNGGTESIYMLSPSLPSCFVHNIAKADPPSFARADARVVSTKRPQRHPHHSTSSEDLRRAPSYTLLNQCEAAPSRGHKFPNGTSRNGPGSSNCRHQPE